MIKVIDVNEQKWECRYLKENLHPHIHSLSIQGNERER